MIPTYPTPTPASTHTHTQSGTIYWFGKILLKNVASQFSQDPVIPLLGTYTRAFKTQVFSSLIHPSNIDIFQGSVCQSVNLLAWIQKFLPVLVQGFQTCDSDILMKPPQNGIIGM